MGPCAVVTEEDDLLRCERLVSFLFTSSSHDDNIQVFSPRLGSLQELDGVKQQRFLKKERHVPCHWYCGYRW